MGEEIIEGTLPVEEMSLAEAFMKQRADEQMQAQRANAVPDITNVKPISFDASSVSDVISGPRQTPPISTPVPAPSVFDGGNNDMGKSVSDFVAHHDTKVEDFKQQSPAEDLVFLGRMTKAMDFHGHHIEMQTLNGMDNLNIVSEVSHLDPVTRLAASIIGTIVRSIRKMDGQKLYATKPAEIPVSKFKDIEDAKQWILDMQQPVIDELYIEYAKLDEDQRNQLGQLKNL